MKFINIKAPQGLECRVAEWEARYHAHGTESVRIIRIESRSAIEVVVSKVSLDTVFGSETSYYISTPNFGVAIPSISTLLETGWITDKLLQANMSAPDAVTIAHVLRDMGDF